MTSTFFPDGSFEREWVDTSLRMVDLRTEGAALAEAPRRSSSRSLRGELESVRVLPPQSVAVVLMLASLVSKRASCQTILRFQPPSRHNGPQLTGKFSPGTRSGTSRPPATNNQPEQHVRPTTSPGRHPPPGSGSPACSSARMRWRIIVHSSLKSPSSHGL